MKLYTQTVSSCYECPEFVRNSGGQVDFCCALDRNFTEEEQNALGENIPKDCPLDDH
jgi:hypothetical protein